MQPLPPYTCSEHLRCRMKPHATQGASVIASFFSLEAGSSGGHVVDTAGCESNSVQKAGSTVQGLLTLLTARLTGSGTRPPVPSTMRDDGTTTLAQKMSKLNTTVKEKLLSQTVVSWSAVSQGASVSARTCLSCVASQWIGRCRVSVPSTRSVLSQCTLSGCCQ